MPVKMRSEWVLLRQGMSTENAVKGFVLWLRAYAEMLLNVEISADIFSPKI
ncbi:MAG: hypothetical protein Q4E74_11930 [Ruminococcus sp.]|nr:hypothetical protein [Ruminococcus sp.]